MGGGNRPSTLSASDSCRFLANTQLLDHDSQQIGGHDSQQIGGGGEAKEARPMVVVAVIHTSSRVVRGRSARRQLRVSQKGRGVRNAMAALASSLVTSA
jgi:hypothetical protein